MFIKAIVIFIVAYVVVAAHLARLESIRSGSARKG
jgi:hypothetical protein